MNVLTEKIAKDLMDYLKSVQCDYEEEEIKNCIEIINENKGQQLSNIDNTLLNRIIDDDELNSVIESITTVSSTDNAFD